MLVYADTLRVVRTFLPTHCVFSSLTVVALSWPARLLVRQFWPPCQQNISKGNDGCGAVSLLVGFPRYHLLSSPPTPERKDKTFQSFIYVAVSYKKGIAFLVHAIAKNSSCNLFSLGIVRKPCLRRLIYP